MENFGTLRVRTYVSRAEIPVPGASVIIYQNIPGGKHHIFAMQITDENGSTAPITLKSGTGMGLYPGAPLPYSDYQLLVEHPDFQLTLFENLQIFPGIETVQSVPLTPISPNGPQETVSQITPQPL